MTHVCMNAVMHSALASMAAVQSVTARLLMFNYRCPVL